MTDLTETPIAELIERWAVHGATPWAAVVGHAPQVRRLQEIALRLALSDEERARLRLRVGAGLLLYGPPGTGKTLLARAFATAIDRPVIAPPTAELTPALLVALYDELANRPPVVVVLDEADGLVAREAEAEDLLLARALLSCIDGVRRPVDGPITIALTTLPPYRQSRAATRPGRLSPHLALDVPTPDDRHRLFARLIEGLPVIGSLDLEILVERTAGWSGAELAGVIEEAVGRSLRDGAPAQRGVRQALLLEVMAERFDVADPPDAADRDVELFSIHESGHALYARLTWGPGSVGVVKLDDDGGSTELAAHLVHRRRTTAEYRREAAMSLAGAVAEELLLGTVSHGTEGDLGIATDRLARARLLGQPFDEEGLEAGTDSDRGADRMREARYRDIAREAELVRAEVRALLAPRRAALAALAAAVRDADRQTISGATLTDAIEAALATSTGVVQPPLPTVAGGPA